MAKLDFVPKVGPFRFTAGVGQGCFSALGIVGIILIILCCCGGLFFTTGN